MPGPDGPTLPLPWLHRICLPSIAIANPPDPTVADEYLKRGYLYVLTQTLLALSILQDLYATLSLISATKLATALDDPETYWVLRALRVVSAPQSNE